MGKLRRLGYVAIALSIDATTNRTCRLANASPDRLRGLIQSNLDGLARVLLFNLDRRIFLYRISSQLIPFASHPVNQIRWWDEYAPVLDGLGRFIRQHGMRVSMHPGQFTVLSSPDRGVVAASVAELAWHARLLDSLGVDTTCKIVLHVGGAYGDKREAARRFAGVVRSLPETVRRRLVIENDERVYAAEEVLAVARETGVPVVFDWLHHTANPGDTADVGRLLRGCFATWGSRDGTPVVHLSSQAPGGRPGKHADWVDPDDFAALLDVLPGGWFDCMLEAKRKDQALLALRDALGARGIVETPHALPGGGSPA